MRGRLLKFIKIRYFARSLPMILGLYVFSAAAERVSVEDATFFYACGYNSSRPSVPYNPKDLFDSNQSVKSKYQWSERDSESTLDGKKLDRKRFKASRYIGGSFKNPLCDLELLRRLDQELGQEGGGYVRARKKEHCEGIKDSLLSNYVTSDTRSGASASYVSEGVFSGGVKSSASESEVCQGDVAESDSFACNYAEAKENLAEAALQQSAAMNLLAHCRAAKADMVVDENGRGEAGILHSGGVHCYPGGTIVIEKNTSPLVQVTNSVLKAAVPISVAAMMYKVARKQQGVAKYVAGRNADLGFPNASGTAGGLGGAYGGGAYTGHGGACGYGYCGGNGGVVVGAGGYQGGVVGGGGCGVPPYAYGYAGCGQGAGAYGQAYGNGFGNGYGGGQFGPGGGWNQGGQFGPGGQYGGPQYWGSNPINQELVNQQAAEAAAYAKKMALEARKAQESAKLADRAWRDYEDAGKKYQKAMGSYYNSYSYISGAGGGGYQGGGGGYYQGGGDCAYTYCGGTSAPSYYPPYSSGGTGVSFDFNYSKQ